MGSVDLTPFGGFVVQGTTENIAQNSQLLSAGENIQQKVTKMFKTLRQVFETLFDRFYLSPNRLSKGHVV